MRRRTLVTLHSLLVIVSGCSGPGYVERESPRTGLRAWRGVEVGAIETRRPGGGRDAAPFGAELARAVGERIAAARRFPGGAPVLRLKGIVAAHDPGPAEGRGLSGAEGNPRASVRIEWTLEGAGDGKRVARFMTEEGVVLSFDVPPEALWYRVADRVVEFLGDHY